MRYNPQIHGPQRHIGTLYFGEEEYSVVTIWEMPNGEQIINLVNIRTGEESKMMYKRIEDGL
jgi:hypothetical protein